MVIKTKQMNNRILFLFQEARIEGARQQVGDMKLFTLPAEIREHDRRPTRKLPDDLTTSAARRRQCLRVSHDSQLRKLSLAFRQRFPDRDAFRAHSQSVTRALDIAASVDFAALSPDRRTNEEI